MFLFALLQGNTARLRITELEPIRERYEPPVGDVLVEEPIQQKWVTSGQTALKDLFSSSSCEKVVANFISVVSLFIFRLNIDAKDHNSITLSFEHNKIVIQSDPLRIDVVSDNEPVISINSRGLLKYEHYRSQPWVLRLACLDVHSLETFACLQRERERELTQTRFLSQCKGDLSSRCPNITLHRQQPGCWALCCFNISCTPDLSKFFGR